MFSYLNVAEIIVSIVLIMLFLLQVRGGGLGGIFGSPDTVFRTRRGVERTLFRLTILLLVLFISISIVSIRIGP
jgi:preprotein translocase subunit SecG